MCLTSVENGVRGKLFYVYAIHRNKMENGKRQQVREDNSTWGWGIEYTNKTEGGGGWRIHYYNTFLSLG